MVRTAPKSKAPPKPKPPPKAKATSSTPEPRKRSRVEASTSSHSGKGKQKASAPNEQQQVSALFDKLLPAPIRCTDITSIHGRVEEEGPTLTTPEHQARDDSLAAHQYGMLDLMLRIGGRPATDTEKAELNKRFPLTVHAKRLVGLTDDEGVPPEEDLNTPDSSVQEDDDRDDLEYDEELL